jgi:hypothetical protein
VPGNAICPASRGPSTATQLVVLLHKGLSDRHHWRQVAEHLAPQVTVMADNDGFSLRVRLGAAAEIVD